MALTVQSGFDLADEGSYVLNVVETGGNTFAVTIASGTYFLARTAAAATGDHASLVTGYVNFLTAVQTALNAGTDGGSGYTVTLSTTTNLVTITRTSAAGVSAVSLTPTSRGYLLGHTSVKSGALTHAMDVAPRHWLNGAIGFWAGYLEREDNEDVATDVIAWSGRPHGIAREGVPVLLDMSIPLEPRAMVYRDRAAAASPWTWEAMFRHCRNVRPLAIDDDEFIHYCLLTDKGSAFVPTPRSKDYVGHYDIPLRMRLLAREAS